MFFESLTTNLFGIVVALVAVLVVWNKWSHKYWQRRGVESPPSTIFIGNAGNFFFGRLSFPETIKVFYDQFKQKDLSYGGIYFFGQKFFIPTDIELVKCIMQKDFQHFVNHGDYINEEVDPLTGNLFSLEDAKWRNLRVKLTPTFTSGKMKMMFPTLADCAEGLKDILNKNAEEQTAVDIKEVLSRFSTDIIGSCAFGIECNSLKNPDSIFRKYGKMTFEFGLRDVIREFSQLAFPLAFLRMIKFKIVKPEVTKFFINMVKNTVELREKNNIFRKDFMHLLIQLKNMGKVTDDEKISEGTISEVGLTMNEVAAQAFIFFLAGFETSSTTMTFALYEIALNPEIQRKLREEINMVFKKHDDKLTYEAIMDLHYMDKVVNETLRKYPPLGVLTRKCSKDYKVPNSDLTIEKGTMVGISTFGIQYDHEYYPNPIVFDPERFSEENKASRPGYTWLPFGEGPRICIGLRFGMMQVKVGLTTLLKNYEISLNRKTNVPLSFENKTFILSAKGNVYLNVKKIN